MHVDEEQVKQRKKDKWFDVWVHIEALAVDKDVVESALKRHVEKMDDVKNILVYDRHFTETVKVDKPAKDVEVGYSQIVKVKFLAKDLLTLIGVAMTFGPSSVEIMSPDKKEVSLSEAQNIVNLITGVVHQFAAAGVGGIIITPEKKGGTA